MNDPVLGVIGGSGLYELKDLRVADEVKCSNTPFGYPSDRYVVGYLGPQKVVFLARHGRDHSIRPDEVNYRANIAGMKILGVTHLLSVTAVGSLDSQLPPGTLTVTDQYIDLTKGRQTSFFEDGLVGHVSMADPVCKSLNAKLGAALVDAATEYGTHCTLRSTMVVINGPAFSTRAESRLYQKWGCNTIGMTAMPEAKLAREAEFCYANLALVTDFDAWKEDEHVTADMVASVVKKNVQVAKSVIERLSLLLPIRNCSCDSSVKNAIMTVTKDRIFSSDTHLIFRKYVPFKWNTGH